MCCGLGHSAVCNLKTRLMRITYRSRFLTRAEVWYDNEPGDTRGVDWILYQQRSRPVPGTKTSSYYTYVIDLTQSREQLQANLNKDTAYKIRRARERDKIRCDGCDSRDAVEMDRFEEMYNAFAKMKGRAPLHRARLESMAAAGVLDLTAARDPQGNVLVYHANYRDDRRATSLELPSLFRKQADNAARSLISRANRYLTWNNFLRYQEMRLEIFDFGGWYPGSADQERLDINRFKEGFGGKVRREYQCERVLTFKGRVVLTAAAILNRAKRLRLASQPVSGRNTPELDTVAVDSRPSISSPTA